MKNKGGKEKGGENSLFLIFFDIETEGGEKKKEGKERLV